MTRGRPGKVDKDKVLEALKAGKNDTEIAEAQDCQRQYIQYLRRRWEKEGKLPTRVKFQRRIMTATRPVEESYTFTELQEALLRTILQAKKTEELIEDNWRLQNQVASLKDAVDKKDKELHSSQEYELLIKQGVLPAPLRRKQ